MQRLRDASLDEVLAAWPGADLVAQDALRSFAPFSLWSFTPDEPGDVLTDCSGPRPIREVIDIVLNKNPEQVELHRVLGRDLLERLRFRDTPILYTRRREPEIVRILDGAHRLQIAFDIHRKNQLPGGVVLEAFIGCERR